MAEEVQGPILSVGASFDDLRQKRNDFRAALDQYRVEVAEATASLRADQRAYRDADSADEKAYYQTSIQALQASLEQKRVAITQAQQQINAITREVPSLPLKVEVTGVGQQALEAITLIRDQFGELLGPLNGVTGRISSLIETFKLLGQIGSESTANTAAAAERMVVAVEAEGAAAVAAAEQTELFGAALDTEAASADRAAIQSELFGASLGEIATAEKAAAVGTLEMDASIAETETGLAAMGITAGLLVTAIGGVAIAVIATAAAAFEAGKSTAELADHYNILAQRAGVSAQEIQGMTLVAKVSGVSIDEFALTLERLSFNLSGAGRGGGVADGANKVKAAVEIMIGSVKDASGAFLSPVEILKKLADQFAAMPDGIEKTALAIELFGRSGAQLIPTLNLGGAAIDDLIKKADELGISIDGQPEKLAAWNKATGELGLAWDSLKETLGDIGVFSLITGAVNVLTSALEHLSLASEDKTVANLKKSLADTFSQQGAQTLSNLGEQQAKALADALKTATTSGVFGGEIPNIDLFPKDQQDQIRQSLQAIYDDAAEITDQNTKNKAVTVQYLDLVTQLVDKGVIQKRNADDLTAAIQTQRDTTARALESSPDNVTKIQTFNKEVLALEAELDKAQQKFNVLGNFNDSGAQQQQQSLKALIGQIESVGNVPQGGTADQLADYNDKLAKSQPLLAQVKTLIEQLTKARESELSEAKSEAQQEESRTQQIQKTIAALTAQAQAEVNLGKNVSSSDAAQRLAVASKDADLEIEKLLSSAVDKRGQQIPAIIALINDESNAIRANIAVKVVAADIAKTSDDFQKETDKYTRTIQGLQDLTKAYEQGGTAIANAVIGQKLEADAQKLQTAQQEYDLLAQKINQLREAGQSVSATPFVQGPTQNGGYLGDLQSQLTAISQTITDLKAKYQSLFGDAQSEATQTLAKTIADQTEDFKEQVPYVDKLNASYLQTAEAVRQAEIELKLYEFTQKEARTGVDVNSDPFIQLLNKERVLLQQESDQTHQSQVAKEAEQYSIQAVYDKTITKLNEVKAAIISNGQSTLLVDAAIYDAQNKYLTQIDTALLKVGSLKDKFAALFQEIILAGQDFGQKAFQSISKAVDDLSTQIAAFVVTGKANFKALFDSLAESIVKSGIQQVFGSISKSLAGSLNISLPGGKPDGSQGNPLYVKSVDLPSASAISGQSGTTGPLDGLVGLFRNIFSSKSATTPSSSIGTPPFLADTSAPLEANPSYNSAGLFPNIDQSLPTTGSGTGGGSLPLGSIIGGAGIGAGIGGGIGGTVGEVGGAVAGAGAASVIGGISSGAGALGGALGVLGPIGLAVGAALAIFGVISQKIKAKTAEIAQQISASFQTIVDQYNAGNTTLLATIQQTEAARAAAISQLSGKKGGQDQLATLLPQFDQEIAQLQAAQKQVLDTFNKLAVSLSFPDTLQGTIKSLQDLNDQVQQFIDAGGNAATAAQVFAASVNQIKGSTADNLLQSEQSIISAMLQENDLITQRANLIKSTQDQIDAVLYQGVLSRSQSEAQTKAQQIQTIQDNANQQLQSLDDQKNALDAQIAGQAQLFGLTNDVTTLKQTQLNIEKQISAEQAVQVAAEQKLLQQLQALPAGATSVDLGAIATGQGSAGNAQLQHDQTVTNLQQQISELQTELKDATNANGYSNQDREDLRNQITALNTQLAAAVAAPVVQAPDTGVAAATDQTLANAISLALGGAGGLATAIATALQNINQVQIPTLQTSGASSAAFGNINIVVNGSNLTPDQLTQAIQNSLIAAYKSLQGNLQT